MCNAFAGETKDGLECDASIEDQYFVFTTDTHIEYAWSCGGDGRYYIDHIQSCIDENDLQSVDQGAPPAFTTSMTKYTGDQGYTTYIDTSRAELVPGTTAPVYKYNSDPTVMCSLCTNGYYNEGYYPSLSCTDNKEEALCHFARFKNGEDVQWDWDAKECICVDADDNPDATKQWDTTEHKCVNATSSNETKNGLECDASIDGELFYFSTTVYKFYQCENGKWSFVSDIKNCIDKDNIQSADQVAPAFTANMTQYTDVKYVSYVDTSRAEIVTGTTAPVYKYSSDPTVMCQWCANGYYNDGNNNSIQCYKNAEEGWCEFASQKNGESTLWDANECICVDANGDPDATKQWDSTQHKCVNATSSIEVHNDFECTSERVGEYVFDDDPLGIYKCNSNGTWTSRGFTHSCYTIDEITKIDFPAPSGKKVISQFAGQLKLFAKNDIAPVTGTTNVYQYSDDKNDMCHWCDGDYSIPYMDGLLCTNHKEHAWCEFAKEKNNVNVVWDDANGCVCVDANGNLDATKQWDSTQHICKDKNSNEIDGVKCEGDRLGKYFIFMKNDIGVIAEHCLGTGKWDINSIDDSGKYVPDCFDFNEVTVGKKAPNGFREGGNRADWHVFVDTSRKSPVNGLPDVYEYLDEDKTIICGWCASDKFASLGDNNTVQCYNTENEAWCHFAAIKNNANVEWKDNKCECIGADADKEWDTTEHKCKPKTESDKKEESNNNAQQTCEQKYPNNPTARACCNAGETVAEWNEATKQCKCKDSKKEWKNNRCEDTLTQDKAEAAKKVVQQFVKNTNDKASKWKDVEGNFNTARLASDLTAGVVLGTVGGVVSGVVIKKKQIEKGFEVLHCAIGGQSVAGWGDTFTIGFNR